MPTKDGRLNKKFLAPKLELELLYNELKKNGNRHSATEIYLFSLRCTELPVPVAALSKA
jgi:hypothetical protein